MIPENKEATGWKVCAMGLIDWLFFRVPFLSEFFNQGLSKNFGLLAAWHFIHRNGIEGDYLEFGVFRGETFRNSIQAARRCLSSPKQRDTVRFIAFDSFAGLPEVESMNEADNTFKKGEFSASEAEFRSRLSTQDIAAGKIKIVKGWFNETLNTENAQHLKLERIAFANIDCDLYESTVDVLNFITPFIQTGTLIYFDDWFSIKGSMHTGEPKACSEWLKRNPHIQLVWYRDLGITGKMFIVNELS